VKLDHAATAAQLLELAKGYRWRLRRRASIVALARAHAELARLEFIAEMAVAAHTAAQALPPEVTERWLEVLRQWADHEARK
jgi:hypothetical protein